MNPKWSMDGFQSFHEDQIQIIYLLYSPPHCPNQQISIEYAIYVYETIKNKYSILYTLHAILCLCEYIWEASQAFIEF